MAGRPPRCAPPALPAMFLPGSAALSGSKHTPAARKGHISSSSLHAGPRTAAKAVRVSLRYRGPLDPSGRSGGWRSRPAGQAVSALSYCRRGQQTRRVGLRDQLRGPCPGRLCSAPWPGSRRRLPAEALLAVLAELQSQQRPRPSPRSSRESSPVVPDLGSTGRLAPA